MYFKKIRPLQNKSNITLSLNNSLLPKYRQNNYFENYPILNGNFISSCYFTEKLALILNDHIEYWIHNLFFLVLYLYSHLFYKLLEPLLFDDQ